MVDKLANKSSKPEDIKPDGSYVPEWARDLGARCKTMYITKLSQIPELTEDECRRLQKVTDIYGFRTNTYYLSLINWDDPNDPIRRLVIPDPVELEDTDTLLDASHEAAITVAPGLEHKYTNTGVILLSRVCGSVCRFCFRKRIFMKDNAEISPDIGPALEYIRAHTEIDNVLLTGGDPFMLSTRKIARVLEQLRAIPHVKIIRFGSKLPAFNPFRFIDDPELLDLLGKYSLPDKRVYIVTHFNHPTEISPVSVEAVEKLLKAGVVLINQTPLLAGINDDPDVLAGHFTKLAQIGIPPYYFFQCRPTRGNAHFKTTLIEGVNIYNAAMKQISGLAKRVRYTGSHASGKIEILGYDNEYQYFRYHQSKDLKYYGQFFKLPRKDGATWWDDWMTDGESFTLESCPEAELGSGI